MSKTKEKVYLFHIHQYGYGRNPEEAWEDAKLAFENGSPNIDEIEFEEVEKEATNE